MSRAQALAVGLVLVAILVGSGLAVSRPPAGPGPATTGTVMGMPSSTAPEPISVHVAGWVANPGVVLLPPGSIVADAVEAAGGARPGATLDAINLAQQLADAQHIRVPGPDDPAAPVGEPGSASAGGLLSINQATAAELEDLPGVGPVLAERIVAHRESSGPFQTVEDLLDVTGIGEAKLASIRDLVTVP